MQSQFLDDAVSAFSEADGNSPYKWNSSESEFLSYSPPLVAVAAFYGAVEIFKLFLGRSANTALLDAMSTPITHFAVAGGNTEIIQMLAKTHSFSGTAFVAIEHKKMSSLIWLSKNGFLAKDETDPNGFSLPICAVIADNAEICDFVFSEVGKPFFGPDRKTPILSFARKYGFNNTVRLLSNDSLAVECAEIDEKQINADFSSKCCFLL